MQLRIKKIRSDNPKGFGGCIFKPIYETHLRNHWYQLLKRLEHKCATRNETLQPRLCQTKFHYIADNSQVQRLLN